VPDLNSHSLPDADARHTDARSNAALAPQGKRWARSRDRLISLSSGRYIVIGFTAFLLVALWSAIAYQLDRDRAAILDAARTNTRNLTRAYAEHVAGTLGLIDQLLLHVRSEYERDSQNPDFLDVMRNAATGVNAGALFVAISDEHGRVLASTTAVSGKAQFLEDRDYFRVQRSADTDRLYISEPLIGRIAGMQILAMSRPLRKPDGHFAGIVFVSFDPRYLSGFFTDLVLSKGSRFAVIGRDLIVRNMITATGDASAWIGRNVANSQLASAVIRSPAGDYEAPSVLDQSRRLFSYRALADYPLIVTAGVLEEDVLANFEGQKTRLIVIAGILSLIFLGVAAIQLHRLTERKENERVLRTSRALLARAQEMAAIGSFERDFTAKTREWSDEMYRILGLQRAAIASGSETLIKLVHPDDRENFVAYRAQELRGETTKPIEFRIVRPDGAERIVRRESAVVFDAENRPLRRYGTLQDITELRLAEQRERLLERQLLHSQKLEALGTLAGGIAHDLNNSLTPIMALSKITARMLQAGSKEHANLTTIYTASEQARDLVKRVLAFSRRDKLDKKPESLRGIVEEALELLRATIPTSIHLDVRISEVPQILADRSQIHQVVTNLISNAAHAIGTRIGVITVTLDVVQGPTSLGSIRLSVIDTGDGMDETTRERIFEPFFTTKQVGQGTGLGLSIIAGIVAEHGGKIEVDSEPGQGSRFDIDFPLPDASASAAA
jgi:PAS domain S-box-containing protein